MLYLILGAGIKNLQLNSSIQAPAKTPAYFPTLATIDEEEDVDEEGTKTKEVDSISEIQKIESGDELEEIDPENASDADQSTPKGKSPTLPPAEGSIGHNLKKVSNQLMNILM